MGVQGFKQLFNAFYRVFEAFDCIGWIGEVRCILIHLALEVFAELRNLSVHISAF